MNVHPASTRQPQVQPDAEANRALAQVEQLEADIRNAVRSEDGSLVRNLIATAKAFVRTTAEVQRELDQNAREIDTDPAVAQHLSQISGRLSLFSDRIERGIEHLNSRAKQIAEIDKSKQVNFDEVMKARDAIAAELREHYPRLVETMADLLERAAAVQQQVTEANRNRPSDCRPLLSVEAVAGSDRGPDDTSLLRGTTLRSLTRLSKRDEPFMRFNGRSQAL